MRSFTEQVVDGLHQLKVDLEVCFGVVGSVLRKGRGSGKVRF